MTSRGACVERAAVLEDEAVRLRIGEDAVTVGGRVDAHVERVQAGRDRALEER